MSDANTDDMSETLSEIRRLAAECGAHKQSDIRMDSSHCRGENAKHGLYMLAEHLVRVVKGLQARPKLWVVRVPYPAGALSRVGEVRADTIEIGRVDIGEWGDAVPCIAAFDKGIDAAYVAACVGGAVEEWGAK